MINYNAKHHVNTVHTLSAKYLKTTLKPVSCRIIYQITDRENKRYEAEV